MSHGANVPGLENVANLEQLPPAGDWVVALPMKIEGGSLGRAGAYRRSGAVGTAADQPTGRGIPMDAA